MNRDIEITYLLSSVDITHVQEYKIGLSTSYPPRFRTVDLAYRALKTPGANAFTSTADRERAHPACEKLSPESPNP